MRARAYEKRVTGELPLSEISIKIKFEILLMMKPQYVNARAYHPDKQKPYKSRRTSMPAQLQNIGF